MSLYSKPHSRNLHIVLLDDRQEQTQSFVVLADNPNEDAVLFNKHVAFLNEPFER